MRILITGGTGFFGKAILEYLSAQYIKEKDRHPYKVVVLSRNPKKFLEEHPRFDNLPWLTFHEGDILEPQTLPFEQGFSDVLHAATDSVSVPGQTVIEQYEQIVTGTKNILDFSIKVGAERFLLTSSGAVYGSQPANLPLMPEIYVGAPDVLDLRNVYGNAKRHAEMLCALYSDQFGINTKIARCFAFVGPNLPLSAHFAIGNFIKSAIEGRDILITGDGSAMRSYLFESDLASWLFEILANGKTGEAYNVGSDIAVSIGNLANLVKEILNPNLQIIINGQSQNSARNFYIPDISKAKYQLGLKVTYSLNEAIRQTGKILINSNEY